MESVTRYNMWHIYFAMGNLTMAITQLRQSIIIAEAIQSNHTVQFKQTLVMLEQVLAEGGLSLA